MNKIKLLAILCSSLFIANVNATSDVLYATVSPYFFAQVQAFNTQMSTDFATTQASLINSIQTNTRDITSAIGVTVTQSSAGATQVIEARKTAAQALSTAFQAIQQQDKVIDTVLDYGSTGQGYNTCNVMLGNSTLSKGSEESQKLAAKLVNNTSTGTGRLATNSDQVQKETIQRHRELFCTSEESKMGLCTESKLAGGDTNGALLFQPVALNSLEAEARRSLRGNILGAPDVAVSSSKGMTPRGQQFLFQLNRKTALQAFPAYSLASIDAANLQTIKNDKGEMRSPNQMINDVIGRYYGSEEAKKWQATMLNQSTRGLLVEMARQKGANIWLLNEDYERGLRMEGNLASLLLISTEESKSGLGANYRSLVGR
ncbi:hypothetical protein [Acinetobacter sp. Marseille-Q1618]|uniref:hypothetical protein n=1 Tax=Acinetobacter sp. Marseille-Q1618 TaxID=2697502 RepID=UPI00157055F5|nr:hypothetical protein [Acinetobacter sp. Marseille-Q1618]